GRALLTTTAAGVTRSWPVPTPVDDNIERFSLWLQAAGGVQREGGAVVLLGVAEWEKARDEFRRRWPEGDPALGEPGDAAAWREARAREAEEAGDRRAELWHLDRLLALRPGDWRLHARRGAVFTRAELFDRAAEAYDRAAAAGGALLDWYRHRSAVAGVLAQW